MRARFYHEELAHSADERFGVAVRVYERRVNERPAARDERDLPRRAVLGIAVRLAVAAVAVVFVRLHSALFGFEPSEELVVDLVIRKAGLRSIEKRAADELRGEAEGRRAVTGAGSCVAPVRSRLLGLRDPSIRLLGDDLPKFDAGQDRGEGFVVAERVVFRDHEHLDREVSRAEVAPEAHDAGSENRRVVIGRSEAASTCRNPAS